MTLSVLEQQLLPDIAAARAGDMRAFERLIGRFQNCVSSIALAIVKDRDASEDVTQQVFIHVWQRLADLNNPASFLPWLRQITRYRAFNYLRDQRPKQHLAGEDAELALAQFASDEQLADDFEQMQLNQIMAQFITELPAESREIVLLFYREEQNSQQVATLLGITESNVRKKLQRVRELLKTQLLAKYGQLILSTAPGIGLSSAILSSLTLAAPPAAAATATTIAAQHSGWSKLAWLLGGAMIGAFGAVLGVVAGMQQPIKRAETVEKKQQLQRLRNRSVIWVLCCGVLLSMAYELTQGAIAPVSVFTLLFAGLLWLNHQVWQVLTPQLQARGLAHYRRQKCFAILGWATGGIVGYSGLIYGLLQSGRF